MDLAERIFEIMKTYNFYDCEDSTVDETKDAIETNPTMVMSALVEIIERIGEQ